MGRVQGDHPRRNMVGNGRRWTAHIQKRKGLESNVARGLMWKTFKQTPGTNKKRRGPDGPRLYRLNGVGESASFRNQLPQLIPTSSESSVIDQLACAGAVVSTTAWLLSSTPVNSY